MVALASCNNNYPIPPYVEPKYEVAADEKLISIEELKAMHTPGDDPHAITDNFVVTGIVVGDDESGNIYKSLYVQDETSGINFAIDQVNMYNIMPVGQRIYVRLKGLYVGDYNKGYQVGDSVYDEKYGPEMGRYNWGYELTDSTRHFFCHGRPDSANVPSPRIIISANEVTTDMYCTLVTIDGVSIVEAEGGQNVSWSLSEQTINRTARFADGSTMVIRTSGYSNFYADPIPSGSGSITGILALFGSTKQLYIRSRDDINLRDE